MSAMNSREEIEEEKPLDPETEKVRKKLVKFSAVFMGLNMLALMAVLGAIVYKIGGYGNPSAEGAGASVAPSQQAGGTAGVPVEPGFEQLLDVPDGSQVVSASEQNGQVVINLVLPDGSRQLWFYNLQSAQVTGKLSIR